MIDAVLRAGSDDRVVIREVHPRVVFVQSLANPWAAWYTRLGNIRSIDKSNMRD